MSSAARHRSTFELEHFDLKDYLKDLLVDTPLYQDHYNFNQANEYVRFAVDKELEADLTLERDRFPKFDPRNLATVDVRQLFAQHKNLYQTICKIVARSHVQVESEIRQRRSQPFCNEFRQEARVLQGVFHNIIPLAPILPTSSTMNPSQFCLACIIADVSNVVTGKACIFMNTFKSVMYTSGIQAWALYQPEGLVAIVEHFKVFLTGEVSLENIGLSDKKPDNHKYEEELPCLVNIEVLTDYVQRLLKQKHLTIEDKLLKDFYSLHGLSTNDLSDEQLHDVYWALNHFMLNTLK
uniref:Cilia- and flagella-associated protein 206 n=1 Tax=Panagrellus redivivus TaxID=6233 RepID=A0A7E4ZUF2_PANRE